MTDTCRMNTDRENADLPYTDFETVWFILLRKSMISNLNKFATLGYESGFPGFLKEFLHALYNNDHCNDWRLI